MKKYIIIKADTNDADFIQEKHEITDEALEYIKPVIQAIKDYNEDSSIKYQKWNWWTIDEGSKNRPSPQKLYVDSGKCTQDQLEAFYELCPGGEDPIHSIESVEILEVINETKLL